MMVTNLLALEALDYFWERLGVLICWNAFVMHLIQVYSIPQKPLLGFLIFQDETNQRGRFISLSAVDSLCRFVGKVLPIEYLIHFFLCDFDVDISDDHLVGDLLGLWDSCLDIFTQGAVSWKGVFF